MYIAIYIVFALVVLWLFAVYPGKSRKDRMQVFTDRLIAHRGLHNNDGPAPENSMEAFRRAVDHGYGIELDVHETKDERLVVIHDESLLRTCGVDRKVKDLTWSELQNYRLFHTDEKIPLFSEFLEMVNGRVPIIVEVKAEEAENIDRLCESTALMLDAYEGPMCVESFHPKAVYWFTKHRPETIRGQLAEHFKGMKFPDCLMTFLFSCCFFNFLTRPDFIAYDINARGLLRYQILHALFHTTGVAWTVKSQSMLENAARDFEVFIFDSFTPEKRESGRAGAGSGGRNDKDGIGKTATRNTDRLVRQHMIVSGTVTAVGFRYRATMIAQSHGVSGWVKNRYDDRVEMEVQGTPSQISDMMRELRGERFIEITNVETEEIEVLPNEYEFKVRY